ncbi:MAG: permease [Candidatus Dojkabacteria bacterium]|nr:MAG: permease [Candidatus Dojkabacteria bacterium]
MKVIDIIQTSNTNLLRSPLRTFLTILAVFIGTLTLTLTNGLGSGVKDFVNKQVSAVNAPGLITITPALRFSSNPLGEPEEYNPDNQKDDTLSTVSLGQEDIDKIKSITNIKAVYPVYRPKAEYITRDNDKKYTINNLEQYIEGLETPLAAGRFPDPNKNEEILLSYKYLGVLNFNEPSDALGQSVKIVYKNILGELKERTYTIVGVSANSLAGSVTRINLNELKEISYWQIGREQGSPILFAQTDPNLSKDELTKLKQELREKGYNGSSLEDQINQINTVIDTIQLVLNAFAIIVIIAGGIGIINTLLMSVYERTNEIGLLKALGMKEHEVFIIFAIEALLIGFWGGVFGIIAGIIVGYGINYFASTTILKDLEGFTLMIFPVQSIIPILLGTMFVGLVAGTLPAIKASKLNPIDALRQE